MPRKTVPARVEAAVLIKSRRRCCLCFWLDGVDEVVKGQIAHLDHNNENADEGNLAFLCYDHHDEYDGQTSTSKGLKLNEVRRWRDELYREMAYRFRDRPRGSLEIHYREGQHRYHKENGTCGVYRISVANAGNATVENVSVTVAEITSDQPDSEDRLRELTGLKLGVAQIPFGPYRRPTQAPEVICPVHPDDEVVFDFLRLCDPPGNHRVLHASFEPNPQTKQLDQRPSGVLPPGSYTVTVTAQGNNLAPTSRTFDVSATAG